MKKDVKNLFDELFESEDILFTFEDGEEIDTGEEIDDELSDEEIKGFALMAEIEKYHTKKKAE